MKLRGLDESNEEAVEDYEGQLKDAKTDECDNNSVASLDTHYPLDQTSSNKSEDPLEGPSKISESNNKRPREDSSQEESSEKRPRQDSSDVESDYDPFDFSCGE